MSPRDLCNLLAGLAVCNWLYVALGKKLVSSLSAVVLQQTHLPLLLYTKWQLKLLKNKFIYGSQSYKQLQKVFLSTGCVLCLTGGQHSSKVSGT
jgi:hypothetical protein